MLNRAFAMPAIFVSIFIFSLIISIFMQKYLTFNSNEFFKELAIVRGYWASFGASELETSIEYNYKNLDNNINTYKIQVLKNSSSYSWQLIEIKTGVKNIDLWHRELIIENNKIKYYKSEGN